MKDMYDINDYGAIVNRYDKIMNDLWNLYVNMMMNEYEL